MDVRMMVGSRAKQALTGQSRLVWSWWRRATASRSSKQQKHWSTTLTPPLPSRPQRKGKAYLTPHYSELSDWKPASLGKVGNRMAARWTAGPAGGGRFCNATGGEEAQEQDSHWPGSGQLEARADKQGPGYVQDGDGKGSDAGGVSAR